MSFTLHPKLAADCEPLAELPLCSALLMRDHRFPWLILVPRRDGLRDLHDLPREHAATLFDEIGAASRVLQSSCNAEKINVAALGNQVPQLHIHVIARYKSDIAWPGPVWNAGPVAEVDLAVVEQRAGVLREVLGMFRG